MFFQDRLRKKKMHFVCITILLILLSLGPRYHSPTRLGYRIEEKNEDKVKKRKEIAPRSKVWSHFVKICVDGHLKKEKSKYLILKQLENNLLK
jgi:hypothetical protein